MREEIFIEVRDIAEARRFYRNVVGCWEGPSAEQELNLILHGQNIVCGLNPILGRQGKLPSHYNPRTGRFVPDTRYAVALETEQWSALAERLRQRPHRIQNSSGRTGDTAVARSIWQRARSSHLPRSSQISSFDANEGESPGPAGQL